MQLLDRGRKPLEEGAARSSGTHEYDATVFLGVGTCDVAIACQPIDQARSIGRSGQEPVRHCAHGHPPVRERLLRDLGPASERQRP
jgi:hypothetical protein